jgi:hypothetical protein
MPAIIAVRVKTEELVALDRVAEEAHPRLVVADAADHAAELARHDPGA